MMGVNFLSNFAGNILAGYLGSYWEKLPHMTFFAMIATIAAFAAVAIFILGRLLGSVFDGRTVLVPA
jgi:POT family proton-dependent oligopeptide transporter